MPGARHSSPKTNTPNLAVGFSSAAGWEQWLRAHHKTSPGVWLRIARKESGVRSVTYAEALDAALCFGWIGAVKARGDATVWLQRFTPRTSRSAWSRVNTVHAERLIKAGRMRPAGLAAVEAARRDGRWRRAYASPAAMTVPADFMRALARKPKALAFFRTLNRANTYAIGYRLQTAKKPATRARRLASLLAMMAAGKKIHP